MMPDVHGRIIDLAIALGYGNDLEKFGDVNFKAGMCQGISATWMMACLVRGEDKFKALIEKIINTNKKDLVRQINAVKAKVQQHGSLTNEERALLEISALYDNIMLHMYPGKFSEIFAIQYGQADVQNIAQFTQSKAFEESELAEINSRANIYSQDDMSEYFNQIQNSIEKLKPPPLKEPIGFMLRSRNHAVSLTYDMKNKTWHFMDINQWPPKSISAKNTAELVTFIRKSAGYKSKSDKKLSTFSTQIFAKSNASNSVQLEELKKILDLPAHSIKVENAGKIDADEICTIIELDSRAVESLTTIQQLPEKVWGHINKQGFTPVFIAAQNGHASVINALGQLSYGQALLSKECHGFTAAYIAAQNGHASVIDALGQLSYGQALLSKECNGFTAAFIAAQNGHASVINALGQLSYGQALLSKKCNGMTPVFIAAQNGHASIIEAIGKLQNGTDLLNEECNGLTLAHIAAQNGHASVIEAIAKLRDGTEWLNEERNGITPAHAAAQNGHASVIEAIAELQGGTDWLKRNSLPLAHFAAQNGHTSVIEAIAKLQDEKDWLKHNGLTLAHVAAQNGHASVIEAIAKLQDGTDWLNEGQYGFNLAQIAALNGHASVIETIARLQDGTGWLKRNGLNLAQIAAQNGRASVIETIAKLQDGTDWLNEESNGFSLAHIAALNGHASVIETIAKLQNGTGWLGNERNGLTIAHYAALNDHASVIKAIGGLPDGRALLKKECDGFTPFNIAAANGHASVIKAIGELPNAEEFLNQKWRGKTSAYVAAANGHASVIEVIGNRPDGKDLLRQEYNGLTPAYVAASNGHASVIEAIGKSPDGKNLLRQEYNGLTLAYVAATNGHALVIEAIGKSPDGKSLLSQECGGLTPAYLVASNQNVSSIEVLLKSTDGFELFNHTCANGEKPIDLLISSPNMALNKCAVTIILDEIMKLTTDLTEIDKQNFKRNQLEAIAQISSPEVINKTIRDLNTHLVAARELNKFVQKGGIGMKEKIHKAMTALKDIPMNERHTILEQDTPAKKNLCQALAMHRHFWNKIWNNPQDALVTEKKAARTFKSFKQAIQDIKGPKEKPVEKEPDEVIGKGIGPN